MLATKHAIAIACLLTTPVMLDRTAEAKPRCRVVFGTLASELVSGPDCPSPLGLCSRGRFTGGLRDSFFFTLLTLTPNDSTETTGVMHYTGEMVVSTRRGDIVLKEIGAFDVTENGPGDVAAIGTVIEGGSGRLRIQGTFTVAGGGHSAYIGEVCTE